jgi:hypothetical protein
MEVVVTVTRPAEPVNSVPMTPAAAEGRNMAEATTAQQIIPNFTTCLFSIVLFSSVNTKLISKVNN